MKKNIKFDSPSFLGGKLLGSKAVRIAYLDEAGVSNVEQEPHLVVAAAIIEPDEQWHKIRQYFSDTFRDFFEPTDPYCMEKPFVPFHMKEIWHGSKNFDRKTFPRNRRMKLVGRLSDIPRLFNIPICYGVIDRTNEHYKNMTTNAQHAFAYHMALQAIDQFMKKSHPDEMILMVAEDRPKAKAALDLIHSGARIQFSYDEELEIDPEDQGFQSSQIMDTVSFSSKTQSMALQIADTAAFLFRRQLDGKNDVDDYIARFGRQIYHPPENLRPAKIVLEHSKFALIE